MTEPGRGLSIERRLPLLMTAVLVAVLATSLVLTYRTLATTARATAAVRLLRVARLLATSSEQSMRARVATLARTAHRRAPFRAASRSARSKSSTASSYRIAIAARRPRMRSTGPELPLPRRGPP